MEFSDTDNHIHNVIIDTMLMIWLQNRLELVEVMVNMHDLSLLLLLQHCSDLYEVMRHKNATHQHLWYPCLLVLLHRVAVQTRVGREKSHRRAIQVQCAYVLIPTLPRAANHYVLAVVCYGQGHCTMLLRSWSYHYALPQKNKNCLFSIPCIRVGIKFASNRLCVCLFVSEMLVVPQPIGVRVLTIWPIVAFGSIPTFMRHLLARWLPFSIISNRHAEARSWKRAPRWWISPKKRRPKFPGRVLYRTVSVRCTINAERQACEVQRLLLQFLWLFCRPWRNVRRVNLKRHINKGKAIGSTLKISH